MIEIACVAPLESRLGEGAFWDAGAKKLYCFDILAAKLFAYDPATNQVLTWSLPARASAGAPLADEPGLLISAEDGLWRFDPKADQRRMIGHADRLTAGYRSNDGKVDPCGRMWWSTMYADGGKRPGAVYRFDGHDSHRMFDGIHIANTLAFSPDGRTGYVSDSAKKVIWRFEFDPAQETVGAREIFAEVQAPADPDGAAMDAEGCLWVAMWGGARVDRFSPEGKVIDSIPTPVEQPSCCAFGGEALDTLYITSAWDGLSDEQRQAQPLAGGLFAAKPGVKGLAIPPVRAEP